jgi:hypothetical protein
MQEWERLPDPADMTGNERAAEMQQRGTVATVAFSLIHARIEALVGRDVFTHEMGMAWDALVEEARTHDHPHPRQAIKMLEDRRIEVMLIRLPDNEASE